MADKKMYKVGITVKEPWSADISYEVLDITLYAVENGGDGCSYIAIRANQGVTPGTDDTVWVKATQRGQSIYDLAVKYGDFEGTEAEFEAEYEAAVHAAQSAAQSASDIEAQVETNEAARVTAERARSDAETARSSAETARINAENARNDAESLRDTAESDRVRAEAGRVTAEASRVEAETFRQGAEQSRRQQFEGLKTDMETAIENVDAKSAEIAEDIEGYEANEAGRVSAENARATAESSRVSAESARAAAETERQTAEGNRATAEAERASAEGARATAEQGRVSAESGRVSAESERVAAETARESASATAVQNAETATADANTAAEHAEEAAATIDDKIAGKADKSEVSQLSQQINGVDNSETTGFQVTTGARVAVTLTQELKAGTYTVSSPNFDALLSGLTLYFRRGDNTEISHGTYKSFALNGLTLEEDCEIIYFFASSNSVIGTGELVINFTDTNPTPGIRQDLETLENKIFDGELDVYLVQGGYYNGAPNSSPTNVRFDRMFADTELPIKISVPTTTPARLFRIYRYSTAGDYTSYIDQNKLNGQYNKEIVLDKSWLNGAKGLAISFEYESDTTHELTPAMMTGVVCELYTLNNRLDDIMPPGPIYFGEPIALGIKDKVNTMASEVIIEHTPTSYVYTRYNQSMAIYKGKAFCFNDTHTTDETFCVVIDVDNKTVLSRVSTFPSNLGSSHLNNATFTNIFYEPGDTFPLLLLSRGDYADGTADDQEMYIFRISAEYAFTLIKTIKTSGTYYFNPSWDYDDQRGMIWGHLHKHGDWRWEFGSDYRKFNGNGLYFQAFADTQYICIVTDEVAATSADITVTVGRSSSARTKTVAVTSGGTLNPADTVLPYVLTEGGYSYISVNQSAEAFSGKYIVCACDATGGNRIPINFQNVIRGFPAPNLRDGTTITISDLDMTPEIVIDAGIFQGGCGFGGKLIIPFSEFSTINGQPISFMSSQNTIVVDPTSGNILSVIPTGRQENQGCAVYNGKLYISSHNANAGADDESFNITAYSFF